MVQRRTGRASRCCVFAAWVTAMTLLIVAPARAEVKLPRVIGNNMVLQRGIELPIWGWAEPGEEVTVKLGEAEVKAAADAEGKWMVKLPAMEAGGPHEMTVTGKNTVRVKNILVGEVWVCSGQSNMEWGLRGAETGAKEAAAANYPSIRLLQVQKRPSGVPLDDVASPGWRVCSPKTAGGFSAVGYFFGRDLHKSLDVPVGLINTSWSGTRIEPWIPPEGYAAVPKLEGLVKHIVNANVRYRKAVAGSLDGLEAWIPAAREALKIGKPIPTMPPVATHPLANHYQATGLYNGMVHGLVPFGIRGAIWYQGESNRGEGMMYYEKMKALIGGWRKVWAQGDFPFLYVQLAPYRYGGNPVALAKIWEAQVAALEIPNTGMAVTVDIGNVVDIHPRNKRDVGGRLALWALAKTYGKEGIVYSGPLYKGMEVGLGEITVTFDHVGGGLVARDGKALTRFEIAGEDRKFVPATATIDGKTIVVASKDVAEPVAVRFAWHQEAEPNLMNKEGLPASPFRTDDW